MSFQNFTGFGPATAYIYQMAQLTEAKKNKKLLADHLFTNVEKAHPVIESAGINTYIPKGDVTTGEMASAIRKCSSYYQKLEGMTYQYLVTDVLRAGLPKGYDVLTEVKISGFSYDIIVLAGGDYRIDVEVSKHPYNWIKEVGRHKGNQFFFVTPGYGVHAEMVKSMVSCNCFPVFTVGCVCDTVPSIDQFITNIPEMFKQAESGTTTTCCHKV